MADLAFVSAVSGSNYTGTPVASIATSSLTFTAGNLIVVKVRALGTVTGISDTLGNSYTLRASDAAGSIRIYSRANCNGGSSAITAAFSPSIAYVSIVAEQFSAAAKSSELIDDFPVAAVTSGTTIDNPYDTGGYAKALVVGIADVYAAGSFGFAAQGTSGDPASYTESVADHTSASFFYRLPTAPLTSDTVRATCTASGSEKHLLVATFKPLNAYAKVSDAVSVSEFVKVVLTPVAVHASDSVTVSESATVAASTVGATIQIFQSRLDSALSGTNTVWNQPFGGSEGWSTTEAIHQVRVLRACTVRNFAVQLTTAPGGSTTRTFTIRKNGSNTALTFAITGSSTSGSDFVSEVSFAAGDLINVQIAQSGGTPAATGFIHYSLEVECTAANTSIYGSARGGGGVVVGRVQGVFAGYEVFTDPSVDGVSIATSVAACAGSLTEYRIDLAGAPTAGKSWTFVIYKNGTKQDGTGGTTDTQLTIADAATTNSWTGTLTVAAGDLLRYQVESSSGSPASSAGSTACVFVSTTAGESHWCGFGKANASPLYIGPLGMNTQSATEADAQTKVLGPTAFSLLRLYGHRHSTDYTTLTLRNNGSNTALAVTLSTGTTVSDTDTISPAQNDLLSLSLTGSSGFFTGRVGSGLCLYVLVPPPPTANESITVSEFVKAVVNPLAVHASESVTVSESVTKRVDAPLEYLTTAQQVYPTGGSGISVTPSGTGFSYGGWVELHASIPADWVIFGCDVACPAVDQVQFQIGIGSVGNETAVITVRDVAAASAEGMYFYTPVPIDGFPSGSRVSVRMWVGSANVTAWTDFRVWYYTKPLSHTITTAATCTASTGVNVTGNGSVWGNSAWVAVETSSPAEYAIGGLYFSGLYNTDSEWDIGTGAAASETVIATIKHQRVDNGSNGSLRTAMVRPLVGPIAAGTRISVRVRKNDTNTSVVSVGFLYVPSPTSSTTQIVSATGPAGLPAAGEVAVTPVVSWGAFGAWTEVTSALPSDGALTALAGYINPGIGDAEIQLGVGAASSEVVIGTWRWHFGSVNIGGGRRTHNLIGLNVSSGQRLAIRARQGSATASSAIFALEWVPSQSAFRQHTRLVAATIPSGASTTSASSAGSWANSSWVQLTAGISTPIFLNAVVPIDTGSAGPYEVDIGLGGSGSEVVATTLHVRYHGNGNERRPLGVALRIATNTRISFRVRTGSAQSQRVALDYVADAPAVDASVSDSVTVTDSVTGQLGLATSVSDSITVAESVTTLVNPLAVHASDSITVTESVTANIGALPRQVLFGRNANPGTGGAKYTSITSALGTWDTEALRRSPCPAAGVLRNLVVELSAAPGGGRSRTFTLRKNGAATTLTVTISNTATTARLTGTDVSVSVGDLLALEATRSGSAAAASVRWSLEFEGSGSGYTSALGTTNSASGTRYAGVFAFTGTLATPVSDTRNVVAAAGLLVRMVAAVNTAPGVSNGLTFYINKNGVRQDGSGGTVNTACALVGAITAVTATFSLSLAAGDVVYTECVPSGSFSTRNWSLGTAFTGTTIGESQCCGASTNALSTSSTQYAFVPAHASPGTTEAAFAQRLIGGVTAIRLFNMQMLLSVAPGIGKSRTLDLRKNATSPGPSVTVSGASTTGSDTASGNVADTNQWNLRATPTSTPAAATAFWSLIQSSAEFETLSVDVHDSVTVSESVTAQRSAHKTASDSVSVSESVTVQLNPLVARVSHTVTVSESVTVSGTLSRSVFDAITVTEPAVAVLLTPVLRVDVSDSITVTDAVTSSIPPSRFVFDTVSVSESVGVSFGTLSVTVHEAIRVRDTVIRNAAEPSEKTPTEFVRVVDVVMAQLYIGGGLAVRVADAITVTESPFNVGYDFSPGTTIPDTTALNVGPEPGVPEAGLGDDYWEDGY